MNDKPTAGRFNLDEGFSPQRIPVYAGGTLDLAPCPHVGVGWVTRAMNIQISYRSAGSKTLVITVESKTDTVLLVSDPAGAWHFDDDGSGVDGKLTFKRAREGRYDIWVGLFSRGAAEQAVVVINEE